jgi:ElaB/YqjD/DUF883 family membrane-anchored ribosome-binding protein
MTTTDMDRDTGTGRSGRMSAARDRVRERTNAARERAGAARERASEAYDSARTRASDAYSSARSRASDAYSSARENASYARQRTADGIDTNPAAALIGGLALGALLGAILPRTRREEEMFGDYGRRLNDRAREAAMAARDAGTTRLDELGFNRETAKQKLDELTSGAGEAARSSATAAKASLKRTPAQ